MNKPDQKRWWVLGLPLALICAACAARTPTPTRPVIKLAANAWMASELNVAVAEIILEEKMGFPVEVVAIDENDQWAKLAKGELHACLEVWPSGHAGRAQKYIQEEKSIENGGPLGPVGKIGWYIPDYILRKYPELATWEGFKKPENVALFAAPETGDKGRFLAGDPGWVQYDADIIRNLGLNLQVVRLGSEEALLAALDSAYKKQEPVLMYFWTPHWAHAVYDLVPVTLPPYSDECYARQTAGGVDCDYPPDPLYKIFWSGFKGYAPQAYEFLKKMNYTTRDQIAMMAMVQIDKKSIQEAARAWLRDHETEWQAWLP